MYAVGAKGGKEAGGKKIKTAKRKLRQDCVKVKGAIPSAIKFQPLASHLWAEIHQVYQYVLRSCFKQFRSLCLLLLLASPRAETVDHSWRILCYVKAGQACKWLPRKSWSLHKCLALVSLSVLVSPRLVPTSLHCFPPREGEGTCIFWAPIVIFYPHITVIRKVSNVPKVAQRTRSSIWIQVCLCLKVMLFPLADAAEEALID